MAKVSINPNHRRAIATALSLLDEMLCGVDEWARGKERRGALYEERNNLTPGQRKRLLREVVRLRARLETTRDDLDLPVRTQEAASDIWGRCAAFREVVMELAGRHMRRYGAVPPEAATYMDALSENLIADLDRVTTALRARC